MSDIETPTGAQIKAHLPDGQLVDVTGGVMALYDLVLNLMDWGSNFLSLEDALPVAEIAKTCGFEQIEEAEKWQESK